MVKKNLKATELDDLKVLLFMNYMILFWAFTISCTDYFNSLLTLMPA